MRYEWKEAPARSDWVTVLGAANGRFPDRAMMHYACPAQDAIAIEARSNAQAGMVFAATAAPPRPAGFDVTTWAGGKVFLPAEEVGVAKASQMKAARGAFIPGNYLYPVPDVTGTPRVWANAAGLTVTRIMTGPYGEELGFYEEPCYSDIGFAGNIKDRFTGLSYTPNRYLDNLQGRFLSVDPSNALEIQDPRSYNQKRNRVTSCFLALQVLRSKPLSRKFTPSPGRVRRGPLRDCPAAWPEWFMLRRASPRSPAQAAAGD